MPLLEHPPHAPERPLTPEGALPDVPLDGLRRLAERVVGCPDLAEDVVQEALIALWQAEPPDNPRAWLTGVVVRRGLHHLRTLARRRRHECRRPQRCGLSEDPASQLEACERRARVLEEVERLPRQFRDPLELYEFSGLPYEEIGARLGIPIGTVRSRISRARRDLRERLAE